MPRTSHYRSNALSRSQVAAGIAAHDYAKAIGCPLNLTMDIHWAWTRFANEGIWSRRKAVPTLLESQRHWLANHGVGFFSILTREAPPPSHEGEHAHQLVHVPPHLRDDFLQHTRDFLRGNKRHQKKALVWDVPYNDGKLAYILKGCTLPARKLLAAMFETDHERSGFLEGTRNKTNQGVIYGKRLLISQGLGPKAQLSVAHASNDNPKRRNPQPDGQYEGTAHALPWAEPKAGTGRIGPKAQLTGPFWAT